MKILIIHNFYTHLTGEDLFVEEISNALKNLPEVKIIEFYRYSKLFHRQSFFNKLIIFFQANIPFYVPEEFKKILEREKPDLVQIHNAIPLINIWIMKELRKRKIPVVFFVHNFRIFCPRGTCFLKDEFCIKCFKSSLFSCILNNCMNNMFYSSLYAHRVFIQRLLLNNIDLFVFPSNYSERFYKNNLPQIKTAVLKEYISMPKIELNNINKEKNDYIIFASRLVKEKGVHKVLEAACFLKSIKFKIFGEGPFLKYILNFIKEKKMKNVEVLGFTDRKELVQLIREARILISPSLGNEVYPRVIREAMCLSTPVVSSNRGGACELIKHNKTGLLFDPNDLSSLIEMINKLWNDATLRASIASEAYKYIDDNNNLEVYENSLVQKYSELINNN